MFITVHTCVYVYSSIWWKAVKELATAGQRYPTLRLGLSLGHLGVNPPQWLTMGGINMYEPSPNSSFMTLGLPHRHNLISSNHSRRVSKSMLRRYQYMLFGGARSLMWLLQSFRVCNLLTFHKGPGRPNASCDRPGSGDETGRNSSLRKTHRITLTDPQVSVRKNQCIYDMFGIYSSLKSSSWSYMSVHMHSHVVLQNICAMVKHGYGFLLMITLWK